MDTTPFTYSEPVSGDVGPPPKRLWLSPLLFASFITLAIGLIVVVGPHLSSSGGCGGG